MKKEMIELPELHIIGLAVRTNNRAEQSASGKIGPLVGLYHSNQMMTQIPHRLTPGITYSIYTDYESDEHGEYTYFIGEAVSSVQNLPDGFQSLTIPSSHYQRFTTPAGKMPLVVIDAWKSIWQMNEKELGGKRTYKADFEIYDHRASNPSNTVLDIYIGIESK